MIPQLENRVQRLFANQGRSVIPMRNCPLAHVSVPFLLEPSDEYQVRRVSPKYAL